MTQKELKTMYRSILETEVWGNDSKMVDFCMKKTGYIVELTSGDIIALERPTIKKDFCFGYSLSRYDTEDYDAANDAAHHAATHEDYFLSENLDQIDKILSSLESTEWNSWDYYILTQYYSQPDSSRLKGLHTFYWHSAEADKYKDCKLEGEDRQRVIAGYREIRKDFEKKLQAYLKRYGLSKVRSWSYWQDE